MVLHKLRTEAQNPARSLYVNNQAVYSHLRYGVPVKTEASQPTVTIHLIDWQNPEANDFVLVEEVTLKGDTNAGRIWCCTSMAWPSA